MMRTVGILTRLDKDKASHPANVGQILVELSSTLLSRLWLKAL